MILFQHTTFDAASIRSNLGMPEYSYWFVRKAFQTVMRDLGEVRSVADPEIEIDPAVAALAARGTRDDDEDDGAVFLSFNPPHYVPLGLACPTIPVFAWEYDVIPDESWTANPQYDWRVTLAGTGTAIVHCGASAAAVRRAMGPDYPVFAIPAPVHDANAPLAASARPWRRDAALRLDGGVAIDTGTIDLSLFEPDRAHQDGARALRLLRHDYGSPGWTPPTLRLDGVVYTGVFNTADGRKNWEDMAGAFVAAFRDEPQATLILKVTHADMFEAVIPVLRHLSKLGRYACRILVVFGMLTDAAYASLVEATCYAVNTSFGEGQCLPLMEFMSAGRPAVSPDHSAMADYVRPTNAFVIESHGRITNWPHDHREARRCMSNWVNFTSVVAAYRESFRVARDEPARYAAMSRDATAALGDFCADEIVRERLRQAISCARALHAAEPVSSREMGVRDLKLNGWSNEISRELIPGFPIGARDVVVDVGCGDGAPVYFAGRRGAHVALGDVDPVRVAEAEARLRDSPARKVEAHVLAENAPLPFADGFATRVICNQVLEHVDDPDQLMAEMVRIGRPGARYMLAVPGTAHELVQRQIAPIQCFQKPNHVRYFENDAFDAMVERHGLVIERRTEEGFYWAVWRAFVWQSSGDVFGRERHPILDGWTSVWSDVLDTPGGPEIMAALDAVMPERRIVIARKPGGARETVAARVRRLFGRMTGA